MEKQSLSDLWAHELNDLWTAEQEMLDALPDAGSQDDELREMFRQHQARAEGHLERLREIFVAETLAQRTKRRAAPRHLRPNRRAKRADRDTLSAGA
jgi:ferritin-like metal-binding protein YciE